MKQNINIEAEGNELILKNKACDYVIIPKKYRLEVQGMIKDGCHGCIDKLVETLPVMEDYAKGGNLIPEQYVSKKDNLTVNNNNIKPLVVPYLQRNFGKIIDGGGSPSTDSRTSEERNRDYLHPIKGSVERFKESMNNNTNPLIGLKRTVLPAAAGAFAFTMPAVTAANLLNLKVIAGIAGNIYLGNALHSQNDPYTEAGVSVAGRILPPQLNEQSKRIGGINDLKQSKEEFKRGNIKKGLFNVATGIGGIYDSNWIPGRYDDYIDKSLELLNLAGDTNDAINSIKKYKQSKQKIVENQPTKKK